MLLQKAVGNMQLSISRSHVFGRAIENSIKCYEAMLYWMEINKAYKDQPNPNEQNRRTRMRDRQCKQVEGEC